MYGHELIYNGKTKTIEILKSVFFDYQRTTRKKAGFSRLFLFIYRYCSAILFVNGGDKNKVYVVPLSLQVILLLSGQKQSYVFYFETDNGKILA